MNNLPEPQRIPPALGESCWFRPFRDPIFGLFLNPFFDPVLDGFWVPTWIQNGPKTGPKICYFRDLFLDRVLVSFGGPWLPLGGVFELLKALSGSLWTPKTLKN